MVTLKRASILGVALLGMFVSSARADELKTFDVPFSFVVGHEILPAGHYQIRSSETNGSVLTLQGAHDSAAVLLTMPADGTDPVGREPVLVFTQYEKWFRLSAVWMSGAEGRQLEGFAAAPGVASAQTASGPSAGLMTYVVMAN